jgi:tetratricopeptide (TPR) repeat protein
MELIGLLLAGGDGSQALSELLILDSDIPDTVEAHNEVGQMFFEAGDPQRALAQFARTLQLHEKNDDALKGAGRAAFVLGNYDAAFRYLQSAVTIGGDSGDIADLFEVTKLVLSQDPLASRLAMTERIRRLETDLSFVSKELTTCLAQTHNEPHSQATLQALRAELDRGMKSRYRPRDLRRDADGFQTALNMIHTIESATERLCGESSPFHRALLLIVGKHGIAQ